MPGAPMPHAPGFIAGRGPPDAVRTGAGRLAADGPAERAGPGKDTVFRRPGTRAGIFPALSDDDEPTFRQPMLPGPPPPGPCAAPPE
jgi:hypothetical protein